MDFANPSNRGIFIGQKHSYATMQIGCVLMVAHLLHHPNRYTKRFVIMLMLILGMVGLTACNPDASATAINPFNYTRNPNPLPPTLPVGSNPTAIGVVPTNTFVVPTQPIAQPATFTPRPNVPTQPVAPTRTPTRSGPAPVPTIDNNWNTIADGVQWRIINFRDSTGSVVSMIVVRTDPARVNYKVHYTRGVVRNLRQWQTELRTPLAIVNASFFDPQNRPIGLIASNNVVIGTNIARNDAGMFQVVNGVPRIRSMWLQPYQNTETFQEAVQAFPILMAEGQVAPINPDLQAVSARRTVLAQDRYGRIYIIATQYTNVKLADLALWLSVSGLELRYAVNMDGGQSTNLYLATGGQTQYTTGMNSVPVVLAVYRK
jgi:exopolysaccharide biosynthesis protein